MTELWEEPSASKLLWTKAENNGCVHEDGQSL